MVDDVSKQAAIILLRKTRKYTRHSLKSSASILVDRGRDLRSLKRYDGWFSSTVAEGCL